MDPVDVSVCIPYHNEPQATLQRAVDSVLAQTWPPDEIIIVDDGSAQPHVPERVRDSVADTPTCILVVRVTNRGLPAARNTALMLAECPYFLPLDSDDWIEPTYIEQTLPLAVAGADVVLVGLQEHGEVRRGSYMPGYDRPPDEVTEKVLWQMNRFFYCALFRTRLLREVGGYHTRMAGWPGVNGGYEDWDLWIDLKRRNASFTHVNEILLNYSTNPDGMLVKAERNREQLVDEMRKHHGV